MPSTNRSSSTSSTESKSTTETRRSSTRQRVSPEQWRILQATDVQALQGDPGTILTSTGQPLLIGFGLHEGRRVDTNMLGWSVADLKSGIFVVGPGNMVWKKATCEEDWGGRWVAPALGAIPVFRASAPSRESPVRVPSAHTPSLTTERPRRSLSASSMSSSASSTAGTRTGGGSLLNSIKRCCGARKRRR